MIRLRSPKATFRFADGRMALLPLAALIALAGGCSGSSEQGSTAKFDPGKETEQKKIADQHAASLAKQKEYMNGHMPANVPTGPPPGVAGK